MTNPSADRREVLQGQVVSRKTPGDGRLEIATATSQSLADLGADFPIVVRGREGRARVETMSCTCGKRSSGEHLHHFLASELLRELVPGEAVEIAVDRSTSRAHVEPVSKPRDESAAGRDSIP